MWYICAGCLRFHPSARAPAEIRSGTEGEYCTCDRFSNERARVVDLRFVLRVLITGVELFSTWGRRNLYATESNSEANIFFISQKLNFGGLGVACWPLVPKFAGSNPAKAVGFF